MQELRERGLRTKETDSFLRFWDIVQNNASKSNSIFFLDSGEGRELFTDNLEGEDLSGWLIPKSQAEEFENLWKQKGDLTKWNDFVCFAVWEKEDDDIKIYFRKY